MPKYGEAELAAALEECGREPVHSPGAIQPSGCLISLDDTMGRVLQVSANLEGSLGITVAQALLTRPVRLMGSRLHKRLRRELTGRERLPGALTVSRQVCGQARLFHVTAYRDGKRVLVELEPLARADERRLLSAVNECLQHVRDADSPQRLLKTLVDSMRQLTGYERVMVYQFDRDCHGSVVAESRTAEADSYLGQHFPATDIPPQVRQLYDNNQVRSIPDVTAGPISLVPAQDPLEGTPLDLLRGALRAVSPIHLNYLRNMGVGASLSIAMHNDERLWGLVACHGLVPGALSPAVRDAAQALVQIATPRLMLLQAREAASYLQRVHDSRELLAKERGRLLGPEDLVQRHGQDWLALFRACGVGLVYNDKVSSVGQLPSNAQLKHIADRLSQQQREGVWCSSALANTPLAEASGQSGCCGLLAVRLPIDEIKPGWLLLFRPEQIETRVWAGRPEDAPVIQDGRLILSPRRSFEAWKEEIRGYSEPWSDTEQQAAIALGEDLALLVFNREMDLFNARLTAANRRLEKLAHTDGLTGVWNRYRIEQQIDTEISASERYDRQCALLLFDIDHFKQINDTHGHEVGDKVLSELASEIDQTLRDSDYLGRWGGEEFVVLATNSDREATRQLAERLRQCVANYDFGNIGQVTISVGGATWKPEDTRRTLVERADQAMYRAKRDGRNRVNVDD